jgi:hypothetical protein
MPNNSAEFSLGLMSAYYIFDRDEQHGPFERKQIAAMWKQGVLTANAQYYNDATQEWRSAAEIASPIATAFKQAVAEAKRPKTPAEIAEQKRVTRKIMMWIYIPLGIFFVLLVLLLFTSNPSDSDYQTPETAALAAEGRQITAEMEEANRTHDFTRVEDIKRRRADFMRRSRAVLQRRADRSDENARKLLDQTQDDSAFR